MSQFVKLINVILFNVNNKKGSFIPHPDIFAFSIFPITLGKVDIQQWFDHKPIPNWCPYGSYLMFAQNISPGSGEKGKNEGDQNDPPLVFPRWNMYIWKESKIFHQF